MKLFLQILFLVIAYLIGSIPWGFLMGKMKGIDIRQHGSKNIGATNTGRILGRRYAIYAYILDTIKGALFVVLFNYNIINRDYCLLSPMLYGLVSALGHTFPIYLGFKGGKAVATGGGIILGYSPILFIILVAVFFIVTYITKYVSAGSLVAATCAIISSIIITAVNNGFTDLNVKYNIYFPIGVIIIGIIIFIRHKSNISRIIHRQEAKVKWRK
ncbi:MAG TPA: glycerol-3-phosphate 1-O-acyltransferase PlsY [Bacilli bacterium]